MDSADVRLRTEGVLQSFGKALHCDLQSFTRRPVRLAERCHQIVGHVVLLLPRRLVEGVAAPFHAVLLWSILKGENSAALHSIHNDGGTHRHELTTADLRSKCAPTTVYLRQREQNLREPCLSGRWTGGAESLHLTWSEDACKILPLFFSPSSQLKKKHDWQHHCTAIAIAGRACSFPRIPCLYSNPHVIRVRPVKFMSAFCVWFRATNLWESH